MATPVKKSVASTFTELVSTPHCQQGGWMWCDSLTADPIINGQPLPTVNSLECNLEKTIRRHATKQLAYILQKCQWPEHKERPRSFPNREGDRWYQVQCVVLKWSLDLKWEGPWDKILSGQIENVKLDFLMDERIVSVWSFLDFIM
jgi:hypothetical protein